MATKQPLIVIVGETASGKSALALQIAERFNGEIISADSRTIYAGMDIGTAKPTKEEQASVPHYMVDVAEPDQPFTAAMFKDGAQALIEDISSRDKLPVMVGGTGLYIDSVLYDYEFRPVADEALRKELEALTVAELQDRVTKEGLELPNNPQNPRHLIRTLETKGQAPTKKGIRSDTLVIGIETNRKVIKQRISGRVGQMFAQGLEAEVQKLVDRFGWQAEGLNAIGYREFKPYFDGEQTLKQVQAKIIQDSAQYAKRQRTWFKRNTDILWFTTPEQALNTVDTFLNKSN